MKDSELRALVLKVFYDHRKGGRIGIGFGDVPRLDVAGMDVADVLRITGQLQENGLIEWNGTNDHRSETCAGIGKISALGVDVIEGEAESPIPIHIDQSYHVQNVHIEGQHGGVQVAGARSKPRR